MSKEFLDLRELCSRKLIYSEQEATPWSEELGLEGYILRESDFPYNTVLCRGDVECMFRKDPAGNDCVICDSQVLDVGNAAMRSIVFVGICTWGFFTENFKLEFTDGTTEFARAYFSDVCYPLFRAAQDNIGRDEQRFLDGCKIFCTFEGERGKGYICYYRTEFPRKKILKRIHFPDNCLMNILAITLEN